MAENLAPWWVPAGAPDLQKARREAAERYFALGMSMVPATHKILPWRKSLSGCCWQDKIVGPKPVTRKALFIWLHECAHAHLHWNGRRKPRHVEEHEAEEWAHQVMRANGIAVPKAMTKRAYKHVARAIEKAERRGARKIDPAARAYAKRSGR